MHESRATFQLVVFERLGAQVLASHVSASHAKLDR